MSRAAYCRRQAELCREMARQMSDHESAARLQAMSRNYDGEADRLERTQSKKRTAPSGDTKDFPPHVDGEQN